MGKEMPLYTNKNPHCIDQELAELRISQQKVRLIYYMMVSNLFMTV